jgi:hypothetical protein
MTLAGIAVCAAAFLWSLRRDRRPADPLSPSLLPKHYLSITIAVVILVLVGHLVTELTGQPFTGQGSAGGRGR